jgi:uncharacterized protein (TIGR02722 family)
MKIKHRLISLSILLLSSCSTPTINYVDPNAVNNLTTNFNHNDLRMVAREMTAQLIQSGKMNSCRFFTISPVKNATDQYIDTSVMSNSMADMLTDSNAISARYVVSSAEMQNQVDELERQNQSGLYDKSSIVPKGKMTGAQCRIDGKLTNDTSVAPDGKTTLVAYTFFVQIFDIKTGVALWRKEKSISKAKTY